MTGRSSRLRAAPDLCRAEIGVELIPGIPHRRVAVADMHGAARAESTDFTAQWLRADHQIEAVEVEELDGGGEERQELAVVPRRARQPLHERRADRLPLDRRGDRAARVERLKSGASG